MITKTWLTSQELVELALRRYIKALEAMLPLLYNLELEILTISFAEQKGLTRITCEEVPLFVRLMNSHANDVIRLDDVVAGAEQLLHPDRVLVELNLEPALAALVEADFAESLGEVVDLH